MKIRKNKKYFWKLVVFGVLLGSLLLGYMLNLPGKLKNEFDNQKVPVNKYVIRYEKEILESLEREKLTKEYLPLVNAMMMQESKGLGNDPMQVSEATCGKIGCIVDPIISIQEGIKEIKVIIDYAQKNDLKANNQLISQTYNYGRGYIDFLVKNNYQERTKENSKQFSKKMCGKAGTNMQTAVNLDITACYGDYLYYEHVERYLS